MWCKDPLSNLSRSQQQIEDCLGKTCRGPSCQMEWTPVTYTGGPQSSWEYDISRNTVISAWMERDRERMKWKMKEDCWTSQNSTGRKQADKTAYLQTHATLHEKGRIIQRMEPWAQRTELGTTEDYAQTLKLNTVCPAGFWNCAGLVTPLFFPFCPFLNGNV